MHPYNFPFAQLMNNFLSIHQEHFNLISDARKQHLDKKLDLSHHYLDSSIEKLTRLKSMMEDGSHEFKSDVGSAMIQNAIDHHHHIKSKLSHHVQGANMHKQNLRRLAMGVFALLNIAPFAINASSDINAPSASAAQESNMSPNTVVTAAMVASDFEKQNELNGLLLNAVENEDIAEIEELIAKGADVNWRTSAFFAKTALYLAAEKGHVAAIEMLISKGANINATSEWGNTPLFVAVEHGQTAAIEALIEKGADLEAKNDEGQTSLHEAAKQGHVEAMKLLIAEVANLEATDNYNQTSLHAAAMKDHLAAVEFLLSRGANLQAKALDGRIPLDFAYGWRGADISKILNEKNEELNEQLQYAAENGQVEAFASLLAKGARFEATDNWGRTLLHLAASAGHVAAIKTLIELGANLEAKANRGGTPLHAAAENDHLAAVEFLLLRGADFESIEPLKDRLLFAAVRESNVSLIDTLVAKGLDLEKKDEYGNTPLHVAAKNGSLEVIKVLISKGAHLKAWNNWGQTPLLSAGNAAVELLLRAEGAQ